MMLPIVIFYVEFVNIKSDHVVDPLGFVIVLRMEAPLFYKNKIVSFSIILRGRRVRAMVI